MTLITKEVTLVLNTAIINHYESLGYVLPRRQDKFGKIKYALGEEFQVNVDDLQPSSHIFVNCYCDNPSCKNPYMENIIWGNYTRNMKEDGKIYCHSCAVKLFGKEKVRLTKLKNGKTFYQWCIENNAIYAIDRYDKELNEYPYDEILYGANYSAYFKCPLGIHPSEKKNINNFTNGHLNTLNCKMCNSLGCLFPESIEFWSDDNEKSPFYYDKKSNDRVYWKCSEGKHEDFEREIYHSLNLNFRCPECIQERDESFLQESTRIYLENICDKYGWKLNHEKSCELNCKNPETNRRFLYDNEIISNYFKLIVEVHGIQHYKNNLWAKKTAKRNGTTPQQELDYIQWKDQYKMDYALSQGYYYLAIPYWADDKDETWKQLIDDKLEEIYNDISQKE